MTECTDIQTVYRTYFAEAALAEQNRKRRAGGEQVVDAVIEQNIRRQPELWLWSHNRWCKFELTE